MSSARLWVICAKGHKSSKTTTKTTEGGNIVQGNIELSQSIIEGLEVESISDNEIVFRHRWKDVTATVTADGDELVWDVKVGA